MMAISETEAIKNVHKMKHRVNRITYGKLVDKLLYGVALTTEQQSKAAETIYYFFHNNGAGHLIKDLVLKTSYKNYGKSDEQKVASWLENEGGHAYNNRDLANLIHRIPW